MLGGRGSRSFLPASPQEVLVKSVLTVCTIPASTWFWMVQKALQGRATQGSEMNMHLASPSSSDSWHPTAGTVQSLREGLSFNWCFLSTHQEPGPVLVLLGGWARGEGKDPSALGLPLLQRGNDVYAMWSEDNGLGPWAEV